MKQKNPLSENAAKGDLLILKNEIVDEIGLKLEKMSGENEKYKDEVLTKLDDISGQLENLQEDKVLSIHQASDSNRKVYTIS